MKTKHPLILTAKVSDRDLHLLDQLRKKYFPPDRNILRTHLTMFHRPPAEYLDDVVRNVVEISSGTGPLRAKVSRLRHLGAGVAFDIDSPELLDNQNCLKSRFITWLGPQDMQKWKPHITIQNKVSRVAADSLFALLTDGFVPFSIEISGLDLWRYLGGPWELETAVLFETRLLSGARRQGDAL